MNRGLAAADLVSRQMTATHDVEAGDWWADRRFRYNVALLVAGAAAFVAYLAALAIRCHDDPDVDVTIFTTCFQAVGYFIAVGVANIFYTFGYVVERLLRPRSPERYRRIAYGAGFTFSVALPFSIPAMILLFGCAVGVPE